jgi:hypothetical protein
MIFQFFWGLWFKSQHPRFFCTLRVWVAVFAVLKNTRTVPAPVIPWVYPHPCHTLLTITRMEVKTSRAPAVRHRRMHKYLSIDHYVLGAVRCLRAYCTPCACWGELINCREDIVVIIEERPSVIQALNKGVTKCSPMQMFEGRVKTTVGNINHIPPSNHCAQHPCHVDIEVRAPHPKSDVKDHC